MDYFENTETYQEVSYHLKTTVVGTWVTLLWAFFYFAAWRHPISSVLYSAFI